jgi:hypothetical protein
VTQLKVMRPVSRSKVMRPVRRFKGLD